VTDTNTTDTDINCFEWMMACKSGEARTWGTDEAVKMTIDRRPVVIVQDAGAGSEQTLNITTASAVVQAPPIGRGNWLDMTLAQLIDGAPPSSDVCAYRDYMEMVKTVIHQTHTLLQSR
jgi:hypothetical protein